MDPLLSVIGEIIKSYSTTTKLTGNADIKNGLKKIAKDIISSFELHIPIHNSENPANPGSIDISGENLSNIIDSLEYFEKKNYLEQLEEDDILQEKINQLFDQICTEKGDRIIVFIDELDRCKPTFAINLLERIKHYFDNEKITFVFSTNIIELQNTVKNYYGNNFDAENYLDKFFNFRFQLPSIDINEYLQFLGATLNTSYESSQLLFVMEHFKLTMRNINHYLQTYDIVSGLFNTYNNVSSEFILQFCSDCILPILVYLFLFEKKRYKSFLMGNEETFFVNLMLLKTNDSYIKDFNFLTTSLSGSESREVGSLKAIYKMIFSQEKYDTFFAKAISTKYKIIPHLKNIIEACMSCLYDVAQFN